MNIFKRILGHIYFFYGMLLFTGTMLIAIIPAGIALMFPEPRRSRILHPSYKIWMSIFLPLVFIRVKRKGKEKFEKGQNYVVVVNHNSLVDIPVSMPWVPGPNKTLAKVEMAKIPLFGLIYKAGSILLDRSSLENRQHSSTAMQETLKMGLHLTLYPEGTRNKTAKPLQSFHVGAFANAIMAQKPVMPGIIFNTKKILPSKPKLWAWPYTIRFDFLDPISTTGMQLNEKTQLKDKVFSLMEAYILKNQ